MSGQSPAASSIGERLAARLARPVGTQDRRRAALHLLDWTGTAIAGARFTAARLMAEATADLGAGAEIFHWGALGNVLEMDDVDKRALLHPGPVIIPAALVAADQAKAEASALLDAIVRGYEAVIRIGRAVGPGHYALFHNTATCGPFGAAAAVASLFHLDTERTADALSLAGAQASGFWRIRHEPRTHAKQLHTARAAHAGYLGARLAAAGFVGLKHLFEGEQGFFAAMCPGADPANVVASDQQAPWAIHEVSFKPWAACRHAHAAIDAALELRGAGLYAADIERGAIRAYRDAAVFCDKPAPTDSLSARFSLQHAVAVALIDGPPSLAHFESDALARADIVALRARLTVIEDSGLTTRYPARFGAGLDLQLKDGSRRAVDVGDALGDPENPVSEAALRDKAAMLMGAGGMSDAQANALIDSTLALAAHGLLDDYLGRLRAALGGGGSP